MKRHKLHRYSTSRKSLVEQISPPERLSSRRSSRCEDSPHASLLFMLEHIVPARRILERELMSREIRRVQFTLRCVVQQTCHVSLAVLLRGTYLKPFIHNDAD